MDVPVSETREERVKLLIYYIETDAHFKHVITVIF